ncbi:hypothetical protein EVAR_62720_1 [Eumeta japonica]|uniref:Uncharacterized protein n=1 Tax=Eumeta variegata TaxID=151549 RepID=A0A4C1Z6B9_EUMVA|nr:hypothetical protein EVAR_62720_1 [Eumeta japonica]
MTYASPVFAHAALTALDRIHYTVIQNKFCRSAMDAHWCVRNSVLHRDLELPTISKYMKDASKRFFGISRDLIPVRSFVQLGFQPHTTPAYGREGVRVRHFLPSSRRNKREKKKNITNKQFLITNPCPVQWLHEGYANNNRLSSSITGLWAIYKPVKITPVGLCSVSKRTDLRQLVLFSFRVSNSFPKLSDRL